MAKFEVIREQNLCKN